MQFTGRSTMARSRRRLAAKTERDIYSQTLLVFATHLVSRSEDSQDDAQIRKMEKVRAKLFAPAQVSHLALSPCVVSRDRTNLQEGIYGSFCSSLAAQLDFFDSRELRCCSSLLRSMGPLRKKFFTRIAGNRWGRAWPLRLLDNSRRTGPRRRRSRNRSRP